MFYNTYRATKSANAQRLRATNSQKFQEANPRERLINLQKREKLKNLLITKFMQKYGIKNPKIFLEQEITKFVQNEKLNDADLQRLDSKIHKLLLQNKSKNNLRDTLNQNLNYQNANFQNEESIYPNNLNPNQNINPNLNIQNNQNENISNNNNLKTKKKKYKSPDEELAELEAEEAAYNQKINMKYLDENYPNGRIDFSECGGDEWAALADYNRKQYLIDQKEEKLKDHENKMRTKDELDAQIKDKIKREYEEELKDKEYDKMMKEHQKKLDLIEQKKQEELHQQRLREQENRKAQVKDERTRKRIEELKNKKFERNLVKHYQEEIEAEKKAALDKKKKEHDALIQTLKDNELNKIRKAEALKKEKEEDLKFCEENNKVEERKELERKLYFKRIERNANNFMTGVAKEALDKMKKEAEEEELKTNYYTQEKNRKEQEKEDRENLQRQLQKKELKKFLDMQVEEKKKNSVLEKELEKEQARIWKIDEEKYRKDEKIIDEKIRRMNKRNLDTLMLQAKNNREKEKNKNKMSDVEYAMNRDALIKAKRAQRISSAV